MNCTNTINVAENLNFLDIEVNNENKAYELYCQYAHSVGFSVRKDHHSYWPNSRKIKLKDYVCSKAGFKKGLDVNAHIKYKKADVRTGCPAMVRFFVDEGGVWKVKKFVEEHNHELAQRDDRHLLRSSRSITDDRATVLKSMTNAGIRTVDAFSYLADEVGGIENVGFSKRDAYNYIQKEKRSKIENGDTSTLIQLFKERQTTDNMFSWDTQFDELDRLVNFFWIDGMGRIDYDCYGDVIIFDTSYRLNKYNLACAPIVGVNNHWQNVLLGVAFLSEETIDSFVWLFRTFLRVMGDKHPKTIFTDQDQAMARAIEIALPKTSHRLCQWHISKKAPSKIACFNSNNRVRGLFYKCLSKCDSADEFDEAWFSMISEGKLDNNPWLEDLYRIRNKWSTAFNKESFSIGILSTQRSESTNNVCHGISKATSSITDCFLGLESVMLSWRRNEQDEDFKCNQSEIVPIVKSSPILRQASKFYSRKLYSLFETEFLNGIGGMSLQRSSVDSTEYIIRSLDLDNNSKLWIVHFDMVKGSIECSCKKFETMGLLCSHCIRVISQEDVICIPDKYLLSRWSCRAKKDFYAKSVSSSVEDNSQQTNTCTGLVFRNHVNRQAYEISTRAQGNSTAEKHMLNTFIKLSNDIDMIVNGGKLSTNNKTKKEKAQSSTKGIASQATFFLKVKDPIKKRPKGVSNARLKGYWEKRRRRKGIPLTLIVQIDDNTGMY